MGYTTDFDGSFKLSKPATEEQIKYINLFSSTRRVKRDVGKLQESYEGKNGLNGDYGIDGEFFVFDDGNMGQNNHVSVINGNEPPKTQPGLWCQWVLTDDGEYLVWDGCEKFYSYVEWLQYMIDNFFSKWGIELNGVMLYQGEKMSDRGEIKIENNDVTVIED